MNEPSHKRTWDLWFCTYSTPYTNFSIRIAWIFSTLVAGVLWVCGTTLMKLVHSSRFEETVSAGWKWYISNILNVCNFFMALRRVHSQYYFMSWRVLAVTTCCDWCHKNSFMPLFVHLNTCCVEVTRNVDTGTEIYE